MKHPRMNGLMDKWMMARDREPQSAICLPINPKIHLSIHPAFRFFIVS
jgi:hypothetical protein